MPPRDAGAYRSFVRIEADPADMKELRDLCSEWLDSETDISIGRDREDRAIRAAYRRLRETLGA